MNIVIWSSNDQIITGQTHLNPDTGGALRNGVYLFPND